MLASYNFQKPVTLLCVVLIPGVRRWADTYEEDTMLPWWHIVAVDGLAFPTVQAKLHRRMQAHVDNKDHFCGRFPLLPMTAFGSVAMSRISVNSYCFPKHSDGCPPLGHGHTEKTTTAIIPRNTTGHAQLLTFTQTATPPPHNFRSKCACPFSLGSVAASTIPRFLGRLEPTCC